MPSYANHLLDSNPVLAFANAKDQFLEEEMEAAEYYIICSAEALLASLEYYELIFSEEQLDLLDEIREAYAEWDDFYHEQFELPGEHYEEFLLAQEEARAVEGMGC